MRDIWGRVTPPPAYTVGLVGRTPLCIRIHVTMYYDTLQGVT
jgi:hypothetical protein